MRKARCCPTLWGMKNAGWVEEVGTGVKSVKPGDAVICHPLRSCGICAGCRRGEDMYCENTCFRGLAPTVALPSIS